MESYINTLNNNTEGITNSAVYGLMANAFVSKYACKQSREGFLLSKQQGNNDSASKYVEEYLNCYNRIISNSKGECLKQFNEAYSCLEKVGKKADVISIDCVNLLENLTHCNMKK